MSALSTPAMQTTEPTYDVGEADRIPLGDGRLVRVGHLPLAIFRTRQGDVYATQALCPHKAGPLADGITGNGILVCPLHEYKFDLATGEAKTPGCRMIKTYPAWVNEQGHILVSLKPKNLEREAS